jgi:hypothetical protein
MGQAAQLRLLHNNRRREIGYRLGVKIIKPSRILLASFILATTACATSSRPDLEHLYRGWANREEGRRPVVVIGTFSTRSDRSRTLPVLPQSGV